MKIGIIVYSQTGHTYSVASKLQEKLTAAGHSAVIERVELKDGSRPQNMNFEIKTSPDAAPYDALVFGAPVQGFSLSAVMKKYFSQSGNIQKKKVAILITQSFPYPWMGGNQAADQMKKICEAKGASVCAAGIVNWSSRKRENMIKDTVEKLSKVF